MAAAAGCGDREDEPAPRPDDLLVIDLDPVLTSDGVHPVRLELRCDEGRVALTSDAQPAAGVPASAASICEWVVAGLDAGTIVTPFGGDRFDLPLPVEDNRRCSVTVTGRLRGREIDSHFVNGPGGSGNILARYWYSKLGFEPPPAEDAAPPFRSGRPWFGGHAIR